jgi:hypothetical protein
MPILGNVINFYHEGHEDNEGKRQSDQNIMHEVNAVISSSPSCPSW